jgi:hypothetical protein
LGASASNDNDGSDRVAKVFPESLGFVRLAVLPQEGRRDLRIEVYEIIRKGIGEELPLYARGADDRILKLRVKAIVGAHDHIAALVEDVADFNGDVKGSRRQLTNDRSAWPRPDEAPDHDDEHEDAVAVPARRKVLREEEANGLEEQPRQAKGTDEPRREEALA